MTRLTKSRQQESAARRQLEQAAAELAGGFLGLYHGTRPVVEFISDCTTSSPRIWGLVVKVASSGDLIIAGILLHLAITLIGITMIGISLGEMTTLLRRNRPLG